MTNYISFLLVVVLGVLVLDQANADVTCYLCSSLNTTSGGSCMVPDTTTQTCLSALSSSSASYGGNNLGSNNAATPVSIYSAAQCSVTVFYNGNRAPYKIERGCAPGGGSPMYLVYNWVGYNTSYCATSLCNNFNASPHITSSSYLLMSLTSFAALMILYSEKMITKS